MGTFIDLTGESFGLLHVIRRVENSKHHAAQWLCQCECGNEIVVNSNNLRTGHSKSCGCERKKNSGSFIRQYSTKHGHAKERLYIVWAGIKHRVGNPNDKRFKDYGGRGIKLCEEWQDYQNFRDWAFENGYNESAKYGECTIDRIDVNGDYKPSNCRWVNLSAQAKNKRRSEKNAKQIFTNA